MGAGLDLIWPPTGRGSLSFPRGGQASRPPHDHDPILPSHSGSVTSPSGYEIQDWSKSFGPGVLLFFLNSMDENSCIFNSFNLFVGGVVHSLKSSMELDGMALISDDEITHQVASST